MGSMGEALYSYVREGVTRQSLGKVERKGSLVRDFSPGHPAEPIS